MLTRGIWGLYDSESPNVKVLITGANGFIGSSLSRGLRQAGCEVVCFSRSLPVDHLAWDVAWIQGDLIHGIQFNEPVDYIVHCAAVQNFQKMPIRDFIELNLDMTQHVADFGRRAGVKGVIFTSSISLHGDIPGDRVDESTGRINPNPYGLSKHLCELLLRECQEYFPVIALRLCGVVGPDAKNVWLSKVLSSARLGEPIGIVNRDRPFNNIVHTDDLLTFLSRLMTQGFSGFHAFPVASCIPLTIRNVVAGIIAATYSSSQIIDNGTTDNSFTISNDYAMRLFGYEPQTVSANLKKYASA